VNENKTILGGFGLFALWFGAAISMAEIFTGGLLAPLGFSDGIKAILLGHLIGGVIMLLVGVIGAQSKLPAIMSTRISFGTYGSYLFSLLNVLQLIGWTAVMIISGGRAANELGIALFGFDSINSWAVVIALLIALWIALGKNGFGKLNIIAVMLLLFLTLLLCGVVFKEGAIFSKINTGEMSFGLALELSIIMPLSWLPLVSDYTRFAKEKKSGLVGTFFGYFIGSSLMYIVGLSIALYAKDASVGTMMMALHLGFVALGIVLLSTVTTTFLDAYSAGVTLTNVFPKLSERTVALVMTLVGFVVAVFTPVEQYENFLYAIGSVFGPLFAIVLSDYFIFKKEQIASTLALHVGTFIVWAVGVFLYYQFQVMALPLGTTLPTMIATALLFIATKRGFERWTLSHN
jgi:putative hydroxymethylpyrimidine transporter CytX